MSNIESSGDSGRTDTNLSALQRTWDPKGRHYTIGEGKVIVHGRPWDFRVSHMTSQVARAEHPTNVRVVTEVARNLRATRDRVVGLFMGWGETTASFEGDPLKELLGILDRSDFLNPGYIGINTSGRGVREYMDHVERAVKINIHDDVDDGADLAEQLDSQKKFGNTASLMGHSMGFGSLMGAIGKRAKHSTRIVDVMPMMPCTDEPGLYQDFGFLKQVLDQVPPSLMHVMLGSGALDPSEEAHIRMMLNGDTRSGKENYQRSVPDSAERFFNFTANRRWPLPFNRGLNFDPLMSSLSGVNVNVLTAENDRLIPDWMAKGFLARASVIAPTAKLHTGIGLAHALPFKMTEEQRDTWKKYLRAAITRAK